MVDAWQPIETAPRPGGENVLILSAGDGIMAIAHRAAYPGGMDAWAEDSGGYIEYWKPTHWMPLPAPPEM